jgi:UDP-N-acetylglucosamine acyltransferase
VPRIHPAAIVEPGAELASDVEVAAYALIGPRVTLAAGVRVGPHAVIEGRTRVGEGTRVFAHACIGGEPQDTGFASEPTELEIGRRNVIREHVTIHVGTSRGGGCTRLGDDNLLMNSSHVGHDCQIGSHCVLSSFTGLAGHVVVEDHVVLGAYTGVHQHGRVGESVMSAAGAKLSLDAPPFSLVAGDRARLAGLNSVGLRRRGLSRETTRALKRAFHLIFSSKLPLEEAGARVTEELEGVPEVERLMRFLLKSERGFCR